MNQYLIRSVANGRIVTVTARSERGALRQFIDDKDPPAGEYEIKLRGAGDWTPYRVR